MIELWGRTLDAVERQDLTLIDREIDWAIKHRLVERYRAQATTWTCPARGSPSSTSPTTTSAAAAACSTCCSARGWSTG